MTQVEPHSYIDGDDKYSPKCFHIYWSLTVDISKIKVRTLKLFAQFPQIFIRQHQLHSFVYISLDFKALSHFSLSNSSNYSPQTSKIEAVWE